MRFPTPVDAAAPVPAAELSSKALASRRVGHGSTAWSLPWDAEDLRQPQDGAPARAAVVKIDAREQQRLNEPEDAKLTGGTRSLMRRVMGLNVTAQRPAKAPARYAVPVAQTRIA